MSLTLSGLILIGFGLLYLKRPTLYRQGIWLKTSIAIRMLSEEGYKRFMKGLGVAFILAGAGCIAWDAGLGRLVTNA